MGLIIHIIMDLNTHQGKVVEYHLQVITHLYLIGTGFGVFLTVKNHYVLSKTFVKYIAILYMGGSASVLLKKDEIYNWHMSSHGWNAVKITGDLVLRDQKLSEKDCTPEQLYEKEGEKFMKKDFVLGVFKNFSTDVLFEGEDYVEQKDPETGEVNATAKYFVFSKTGRKYFLNWDQKSGWNNQYCKFFDIARMRGWERAHCRDKEDRRSRDYDDDRGGIKIRIGGGNSAYDYIVNPETGRKVKVNGKVGKKVIEKYVNNC